MGVGKSFSGEVAAGGDPAPVIVAALMAADDFAADADLARPLATRLLVAVEELVSNALRHGAAISVRLDLSADGPGVRLELEDDGSAFDPTVARAFTGPDEATGGGVGLELVRAWVTSADYVRREGRNRIVIVLSGPPPIDG